MYRHFPALLLLIVGCHANELQAQDKDPDPTIGGKKLSEWKKDLQSPDPASRMQAIARLRLQSANAKPAIPLLVEMLKDKSQTVRYLTLAALSTIGISEKEAPAIVPLLRDSYSPNQSYARAILQRMGPKAELVRPNLIEMLEEKSSSVRYQAVLVLTTMGIREKEIPTIAKLLKDSDSSIRISAGRILQQMGKKSVVALSELKTALLDPKSTVQWSVAHTLVLIGKEAEPILMEGVNHPSVLVRSSVLNALRTAPNREQYLPQFVKALQDKESVIRLAGANGLLYLGPKAKPALPALIKAMDDPSYQVRYQTAHAIYRVGADVKEALPDLLAIKRPLTAKVQNLIVQSIKNVGKDAVPVLRKTLNGDSTTQRLWALRGLQALAADAKPAIPEIKTILSSDKDGTLQIQSAFTLWHVEGPSEKLLDLVLQKSNGSLTALGSSGVEMLVTRLKSEDREVRLVAMGGLCRFGSLAGPAAKELIQLFASNDGKTHSAAESALMVIGRSDLNSLVKLYTDGGPEVSRPVGQILRQLDGSGLRQSGRGLLAAVTKKVNEEKDWLARLDAAWIHSEITQNPMTLLGVIEKANKEKDVTIRATALRLLPTSIPYTVPGRISAEVQKKIIEQVQTLLVDALKDDSVQVRVQAANNLLTNSLVPAAATEPNELVIPLIGGLRSRDAKTRLDALRGLHFIGTETAPLSLKTSGMGSAVHDLTKALSSPNGEIRQFAAQTLSSLGPQAKGAMEALQKLLKDSDRNLQLSAVEALGNIGPASAGAVPELIELLKTVPLTLPSPFPSRRSGIGLPGRPVVAPRSLPEEPRFLAKPYAIVATALGRIGPKAKAAIPVLEKRMSDDVSATVQALSGIGKEASPVIAQGLTNKDRKTQLLCLDALGASADGVRPDAIRKILAIVKATDVELSHQALFVLCQLGTEARSATFELTKLLADKTQDPQARQLAAQALGAIGPEASSAIPELLKALDDPDPQMVRWAVFALGGIGPKAKEAVPALQGLTKSSNAYVRFAATRALAKIQQ